MCDTQGLCDTQVDRSFDRISRRVLAKGIVKVYFLRYLTMLLGSKGRCAFCNESRALCWLSGGGDGLGLCHSRFGTYPSHAAAKGLGKADAAWRRLGKDRMTAEELESMAISSYKDFEARSAERKVEMERGGATSISRHGFDRMEADRGLSLSGQHESAAERRQQELC